MGEVNKNDDQDKGHEERGRRITCEVKPTDALVYRIVVVKSRQHAEKDSQQNAEDYSKEGYLQGIWKCLLQHC